MASASIFNWIATCGAGIQSSFAWTTYNQTAFLGNVSMRQNQAYQKKNYKISWVAMARDDIRSIMTISVNRLNNYIVVSALILGLSCTGVFSVSFNEDTPKFLQEMFFMSMGMSVVFLMVAITLGVKGQNAAFTHTMKLLIHEIRPENPAQYNHDYMLQAQLIERDGLKSLFRIPGFMPKYEGMAKDQKKEADRNGAKTETSFHPGVQAKSKLASLDLESEKESRPACDGYENLDVRDQSATEQLWYLLKFAHFMRLWTPYDVYCKFSMSLGMVALGHGTNYFVLCRIDLHNWLLAVICMLSPFLYVPIVVVADNFTFPSRRSQILSTILQVSGPAFGLISAYARARDHGHQKIHLVQAICVPMCFFSHALFYVGVFKVAYNKSGDARLPSLDSDEEILSDMIKEFQEAMQIESQPEDENEEKAKENEDNSEQDDEKGWEHDAKYQSASLAVTSHSSAITRHSSATSFASAGNLQGFPTDSDLFEQQATALRKSVKRTLRSALMVSVVMYAILTFWGCRRMLKCWRQYRDAPIVLEATVSSEWPVAWSEESLFRPHAMSCAGPHVFLADRFSVYALDDKLNLVRVPGCEFDERILDVSSRCDESGGGLRCRAAVLIRSDIDPGHPYEIRTCGEVAESDILPGEDWKLFSFYRRKSSTEADWMLGAQKGEVVQYHRNAKGKRWRAQGTLGKVVWSTLQKISSNNDFMLEFHQHLIKSRSVDSRKQMNTWSLPSDIGELYSGCRVGAGREEHDSDSALILTYDGPTSDDLKPRLLEVELPQMHNFKRKRDRGDLHAHPLGKIAKLIAFGEQQKASKSPVNLFDSNKHSRRESSHAEAAHSLLSRQQQQRFQRKVEGTLELDVEPGATIEKQANHTSTTFSFEENLAAAKRSKRCKRSCRLGWK